MFIYLIRHGRVEPDAPMNYNAEKRRPDPSLGARGLQQAERLGSRLQACGIERLYSSDLERAVQTADVIGRHLGLDVELRPALREIDMGEVSTAGWDAVLARYPAFAAQWADHATDVAYPGGECGEDVRRRAMAVIDEITAQPLERVAIVTHGGVIRVLISACLGLPQENRFRIDGPENCSISMLRYDAGQWTVHCVNVGGFL